MPRLPTIAVACTALALALGACGDDKKNQTGRAAGEHPATVATNPNPQAPQTSTQGAGQKSNDVVSVGMKDIKFVPESITAKVGQKIVWTNNEEVPHNVTAEEGADFESDTLQKDQTFEYTPTKAGTIEYVCTIHSGQNGQITVTK
jgi:plastocyanin